eukprot:TRINITY_DN6884_c0_g1_i1.p1 TRINITY_DN6884_c0_g1~~TRINITY_DN6884_c0_g1_i1.p1  ORF type:complete len:335 (+),score=39.71 TRINITY_DN6884_c0_g1_i1:1738-2742(+)
MMDEERSQSEDEKQVVGPTMSPEQTTRIQFMLGWCALISLFLITGSVYFDKVNKDQDRHDANVVEGLLTTALGLAFCCFCLGLGLNHATSYDTSWRNIERQRRDPVLKKKDERTGKDKCLAALFVVVPVLFIISLSSMLGNVGLNYYPTLTSITPCQGDEAILTTFSNGRRCTYFGGKTPKPEPYLRACEQFSSLSCCDRPAALATQQKKLQELISGDRFISGSCSSLLDSLACWVCSPDQALFYRDNKIRVCSQMCDTIMKVCGNTIYDHLERTFGDIFDNGSELCSHLGFVSDTSCSCYEAYPEQDWSSYSSITIGNQAQTTTTSTSTTSQA